MKTKIATTLAVILLLCLQAYGIPARRMAYTLTQPDGTEIKVIISGDEHFRIMTDLEGHVLTRNEDGFYCYALYNSDGTKYSSGFLAGEKAPGHILSASTYIPQTALSMRAAERRRTISSYAESNRKILHTQATKGDKPVVKSLVLLIDMADVSMSESHDRALFDDMINKKGYSYHGAHGSARQYLEEMYRNDCGFEFVVADTVRLSHERAYYFANNQKDEDIRPADAVREACIKVHQKGINFSEFADENNEVNNIIVFCAGKDEAQGGGEDCVWSHQWSLDEAGISLSLDGVKINHYLITTEMSLILEGVRESYDFASIGTLCHEFSHMMGLMDYYDTDYEASGGYGNGMFVSTALMDGGNYNDDGKMPPHYNAVDYDDLGIGNCETLKAGDYTLEPISKNRRFLKMETETEGEYYLFECRSTNGWDKYIGGKGLAIYHINKGRTQTGMSDQFKRVLSAQDRWLLNEINCRPDNECGHICSATPGIRAKDDLGISMENAGRAFYPQIGHTEFVMSPISLTNISMNGENVTFTVIDEREEALVPDVKDVTSDIFQDAAIIQWSSTKGSYDGPATVRWGPSSNSSANEVSVLPYEPGKYSVTIEGLVPRKAYKVNIIFTKDNVSGKAGEANFTTKNTIEGSYPFIHFLNVKRADDGSFSSGTEIPLRVYNLLNAESVEWYFDGKKITAGGNGYYRLDKSGTLKACVFYKDGTKEFIIKKITVK